MGKTNFSKRSLEKLAAREKRYNVFDSETRGLAIAIYPSGAKTFFHLKKVQGWPERTTIGPFPDLSVEQARGKASELNAKLARWKSDGYEGPSPLERRSPRTTLGELVADYADRHLRQTAKNPDQAARSANWMFDRYLASWRGRQLGSIRRRDVVGLLQSIGEKHGRVVANRTVELIRRLYYYAEKNEIYAGDNPAKKIELYPEAERARFLSGDELARLFRAMKKKANRDLVDFVNLSLWTGARRGDVLAMQWRDLDLDRMTWTIPNPKARVPYIVPLTEEAKEILKRRPKSSDWVFPSHGKTGHLVEPKRAWKQLVTRAKIPNIHIHDLRRTLGSWQAGLGASLSVIGKSLGHSSTQATEIYARLDLGPVRASVAAATEAMLAAAKKKPRQLSAGAAYHPLS